MIDYITWSDTKGFWIRQTWDENKKMMGPAGKMVLFPLHRRLFSHVLSFDENGKFPYETVLFSATKKSAKTAISASVGAWYLEEAPPGTEIFVIANSKEHAEGLVMRDIQFHFQQRIQEGVYSANPRDENFIKINQFRIELVNGSFIQVLANSFKASAGSRHALTLWDELWGSCLIPSTLILKGDLTYVPAGELQVGDELIGFDEHKTGAYRSWKKSRVVATGRKSLPCRTIKLKNGKEFTATLNHKWLVRKKNHNSVDWIETQDLKPGYRLMKVVEEWESREDYDAGYIAGALDGEGSLSYEKNGGARLCFTQRKNIMWDEMDRLYDEAGVSAYDTGKKNPFKSAKDMIITKKAQIMKILGSTRPKRLLPKFDISKFGRMTAIDWTEVESVSEEHLEEIVALTTDTETYISEGYCSHNTTELDRRMWDEMTPIPTVNNSLRWISTYAGFENESELLWELYTRGVGKEEHPNGKGEPVPGLEDLPCWRMKNMFTYWTHDPTMPWQTEEYLESQMETERPAAFLRLHMNQWVTSHESFIPVEWFDEAAKAYAAPITLWDEHPFRYWPIVIGVDAGVKKDSTALVGVGFDSHRGKVGIAFHHIWTPTESEQVDLDATVEKKLLELYNKYKVVSIVYDPTHLMQTMLRLKTKGLPTKEFAQTGSGMIAASQLLYDLFKNKNIETYPDDLLRRHIQMAVAESGSRGFRIVKNKVSKRHHVDGAVALAMACHEAVSNGGVDISIPVVIRSPFADQSKLVDASQADIPFPLRT